MTNLMMLSCNGIVSVTFFYPQWGFLCLQQTIQTDQSAGQRLT